MGDLLLMLAALVVTLGAGVLSVVIVYRGRYRQQLRAGAELLREQQDRDATGVYRRDVDQVTTLAELERLAAQERKRRTTWDGSS